MAIVPDQYKVVDIERVINEKNSKLLKNLPAFLITRIKNIICQEELNQIHYKYREKFGIEYVNSLLSDFNITINLIKTSPIHENGRFVYVANHPLGGIDALSFLSVISKLHGAVVSPSNELFMYIPNLHSLIIGINVFGRNTKEKAEALNKVFESDIPIMIFPAGEVSRKVNGKVVDAEWHKSFISKSVQFKRDVIPVFISGQNSAKFYRIAKLRKLFKIKMYLETMYLPQEMLKQRDSILTIKSGEIIPWSAFDKSKSPYQWAQYVKEKVYELNV